MLSQNFRYIIIIFTIIHVCILDLTKLARQYYHEGINNCAHNLHKLFIELPPFQNISLKKQKLPTIVDNQDYQLHFPFKIVLNF